MEDTSRRATDKRHAIESNRVVFLVSFIYPLSGHNPRDRGSPTSIPKRLSKEILQTHSYALLIKVAFLLKHSATGFDVHLLITKTEVRSLRRRKT